MLREIAFGVLIGMLALGLPLACTRGELPALVRCQLDALKVLPEDPYMVTVYDGLDLVQRIKACKHAHPDGGSHD